MDPTTLEQLKIAEVMLVVGVVFGGSLWAAGYLQRKENSEKINSLEQKYSNLEGPLEFEETNEDFEDLCGIVNGFWGKKEDRERAKILRKKLQEDINKYGVKSTRNYEEEEED